MRVFPTRLFYGNCVAGPHLKRGDIHLATINQDVAMIHKLAGLPARGGKASAVNCVIQPTFQQKQQVLACNSLHARSAFKVVTELSFENEIDALYFLLFAQLLAISNQRLAATHLVTMLSRT